MQTFSDVMDCFEQQVSELNSLQIHAVSRKIVDDFLQKLPQDWEKTELESEQPIYLKLADLLKQADWDFEAIEQQLQALDDIVEDMGDDYPADTDFLPITLLNMASFLSQMQDNEQDEEDLQAVLLDLVEQYINVADYFANEITQIEDTHWLDNPVIQRYFEQLKRWIIFE